MKRAKPAWPAWKSAKTRACTGLRYGAIALVSCLLLAYAQPALARLAPAGSSHGNLSSTASSALELSRPAPGSGAGGEGGLALAKSPASDGLALGKQLYRAGRLAEAAQAWQRAAEQFAQQNQPTEQAQALRYLAIAQQDLGQPKDAEATISQALDLALQLNQPFLQAQVLTSQGSIQLNQGQGEIAYATYRQAEERYRAGGDRHGILLSQLNQVQALQSLGFYRRARSLLLELQEQLGLPPVPEPPGGRAPRGTTPMIAMTMIANPADAASEPPVSTDRAEQPSQEQQLQAQTLRSLGQVLRSIGEPSQARTALSQSLALFEQLDQQAELSPTLLLLGELQQDQGEIALAIATYGRSRDLARSPFDQIAADLHRLRLLAQQPESRPARLLAQKLLAQLQQTQASRWAVDAQVNLAESLRLLDLSAPALELLDQALQQAQSLGDHRAESHVLGQQGSLYESQAQWSAALATTRQAQQRAAGLGADEMTAQWLWQEGRILKAQGETEAAISPYSEAVTLLQGLGQDLVAMNPEVQFSFRSQVEPVYRQLVELLLADIDRLPPAQRQARLERSRQTLEALQLAQLQNFLREACETYQQQSIESLDRQAAVFYPIVLADRLEVILSLPSQPLYHYSAALPAADQQRLFQELRQSLNPAFPPESGLAAAQQLYDMLIRPGADLLQQQNIKTLVFVLDGFLRSLPMAVLHDGDRYLVEQYSLALTPGLQLFEANPLPPKRLNILAAGLTEGRQGFAPLPGVRQEIQNLAQQPPDLAQTQVLLNQNFTRPQLGRQVEARPFSILHLATHGQFSSNAEDTFLLTWDDRIGVQDLDQWLSPRGTFRETFSPVSSRGAGPGERLERNRASPIELLILSACQTAKGDRQATLGLAGFAVRSGARSTLATLWSVQDQSTAELMKLFYGQLLQRHAGRAEALRQAQLQLLQQPGPYSHPYYWAPFVLVGNWQ